MKNIFVISGKARTGKDTTASFIKEILKNEKILNLQYSFYIKEYAQKISNWDGSEETKPRELLQELGSKIRENLGQDFFINKIIDDLKVYSFFFDYVTISDARFKIEIDNLKNEFDNIISINIVRPNFDNGLTEEQKMHPTEVDLDDYEKFDYTIINDGTLEDLKFKVSELLKEVENES